LMEIAALHAHCEHTTCVKIYIYNNKNYACGC